MEPWTWSTWTTLWTSPSGRGGGTPDSCSRVRYKHKNRPWSLEDSKVIIVQGVTYVTVPETRVWKPDTFIRNEKSAEFGLVPSKAVYVRVFEDGTVLYSTRNF